MAHWVQRASAFGDIRWTGDHAAIPCEPSMQAAKLFVVRVTAKPREALFSMLKRPTFARSLEYEGGGLDRIGAGMGMLGGSGERPPANVGGPEPAPVANVPHDIAQVAKAVDGV